MPSNTFLYFERIGLKNILLIGDEIFIGFVTDSVSNTGNCWVYVNDKVF